MQRRTLLKLGIGATALLAVAGGGLALLRPGLVNGHLTAGAQSVFRGVGRAVLDGSLPSDAIERDRALSTHLKRLNDTLAAFPASAAGRIGLTGLRDDWANASVTDIQSALQGMRASRLALRQQVYHALRDLTNAAFYADPVAWPLMGYPGPRAIV